MVSGLIIEGLFLVGADKLWLTIGIPTIPRRNNTDYLTRVLSTLMEELPLDKTDPLYKRVRVIVMNNRPGNHSVWEAVCPHLKPHGKWPMFVSAAGILFIVH